MNVNSNLAVWSVGLLLAACAATPDRFYTLATLPESGPAPQPRPAVHVRLNLTIPSVIDRPEMVLDGPGNGVEILEHERWAAPLGDQVAQTLARDIEQRRSDVLVGDGRFDRAASPPVSLKVDIVRFTARRHGHAALEAHWHALDASGGVDQLGSESFSVTVAGEGYGAVAEAYSELIAQLAETLSGEIRPR